MDSSCNTLMLSSPASGNFSLESRCKIDDFIFIERSIESEKKHLSVSVKTLAVDLLGRSFVSTSGRLRVALTGPVTLCAASETSWFFFGPVVGFPEVTCLVAKIASLVAKVVTKGLIGTIRWRLGTRLLSGLGGHFRFSFSHCPCFGGTNFSVVIRITGDLIHLILIDRRPSGIRAISNSYKLIPIL